MMNKKIRELLNGLLRLIYPLRCPYCERVIAFNTDTCAECADLIQKIRITGEVCGYCGIEKKLCICKKHKNFYNEVAGVYYYKGVIRHLINRFKFHNEPHLHKMLGVQMANTVKKRFEGVEFDYVCSVPMTEKGVKLRGYNQSELLAREVAEQLGVEYKDLLIKLWDTRQQHSLSARERTGNLTGVFDIPQGECVKMKTILICDDIKTMGETLGECSKMLYLADAKAIYCVTAAITLMDKH